MKLWRGMENPSLILKHSFEVHIKFNKHFALKLVKFMEAAGKLLSEFVH